MGLQGVIPFDENTTALQVLREAFNNSTYEQRAMMGLFCWSIWLRRNTWIWEKKNLSVFGVQSMALSLWHEWKQSQEVVAGSTRKTQVDRKRWSISIYCLRVHLRSISANLF